VSGSSEAHVSLTSPESCSGSGSQGVLTRPRRASDSVSALYPRCLCGRRVGEGSLHGSEAQPSTSEGCAEAETEISLIRVEAVKSSSSSRSGRVSVPCSCERGRRSERPVSMVS
jgi:hypothetical protein